MDRDQREEVWREREQSKPKYENGADDHEIKNEISESKGAVL